MQNYVLLLGIVIIGALAWWVDSRIPHWFRKSQRGKVIPFSPKYGKEKKEEEPVDEDYNPSA